MENIAELLRLLFNNFPLFSSRPVFFQAAKITPAIFLLTIPFSDRYAAEYFNFLVKKQIAKPVKGTTTVWKLIDFAESNESK